MSKSTKSETKLKKKLTEFFSTFLGIKYVELLANYCQSSKAINQSGTEDLNQLIYNLYVYGF